MRDRRPAIGEIELDLGRYELRRRGHRVKLEKKPMELLIFLVGLRGQLVSRKEIIAKLWRSDLFVDTGPNINNIVRKIRTALGDDSSKPRFLETVVGKGYRFIGPIRVIDARYPQSGLKSGAMRPVSPEEAGGRSERSSLAVVPLMLLGDAADDRGICLGLADALVTRLVNLPGVDVLPISSVLNAPAEAGASESASRLGVRFVVRGAIQMTKGVWRLSMEVLDAHKQNTCFSKKCDLDASRLSDLEDNIAKQIAVALNRPLEPAMMQRRPRYSNDPMAYAEFIRGYRLRFFGDPALLDEAALHLSNADSKRSCWTSPKGHHNRWSLMAVVANQAVAFDKSMLMACPHLGDVLRPGLILE